MRRVAVVLPLSLAVVFSLSARQRGAASAPAPVAMARPAPVAAAPVAHVAPAHAPGVAHAPSHIPASGVKPAVPHNRTTANGTMHHSQIPVSGTFTTAATRIDSHHCNQHFSYPIQGLNPCPTPGAGLGFYGGGYYIPIPYYYPEAAASEQPEGQQEEVAANDRQDNNPQEADQIAPAAEPAPSASNEINEKLSEFVFVQRDGSKLYAVAYSFQNDKLHYVTKDGIRRTVALDSLDFTATQKSNEELGNTVNLPGVPPSGDALNGPAGNVVGAL